MTCASAIFCICSRFGLGIIDHEFSSLVVERKE
jgi:hypothetical protein